MTLDVNGASGRGSAAARSRGRFAGALALALLAAPAGAGGSAARSTATAAGPGAVAVEVASPSEHGRSAGERAARGHPPVTKTHHGSRPRRTAPATRHAHPPAPSGADDYLPPMG